MKEIIEYVLAVVIILSIIPFYNMVATQFYTPSKPSGFTESTDILVSAVKQAFIDAYNRGNISVELPDVVDSLRQLIEKYAAPILGDYYYYVRIYSPINMIVDTVNRQVVVSSPYNMTTYLLLVSWNGRESISVNLTAPTPGGAGFTYRYNYSSLRFKNFSTIVAVSGYGNTWFIGYWLNTSSTMGYVISDPSMNLAIVASKKLNNISFYGFTGCNTTLYYFTTQELKNYTSSWTNITWEFSSSYYYYNITETRYLSRIEGLYNATLYKYTVYLVKGWEFHNVSSGTDKIQEIEYNYSRIAYPVYNIVLATIYDNSSNLIYAPAYRGEYVATNAPVKPPNDAAEASFTITIGMFTYQGELYIWGRQA